MSNKTVKNPHPNVVNFIDRLAALRAARPTPNVPPAARHESADSRHNWLIRFPGETATVDPSRVGWTARIGSNTTNADTPDTHTQRLSWQEDKEISDDVRWRTGLQAEYLIYNAHQDWIDPLLQRYGIDLNELMLISDAPIDPDDEDEKAVRADTMSKIGLGAQTDTELQKLLEYLKLGIKVHEQYALHKAYAELNPDITQRQRDVKRAKKAYETFMKDALGFDEDRINAEFSRLDNLIESHLATIAAEDRLFHQAYPTSRDR